MLVDLIITLITINGNYLFQVFSKIADKDNYFNHTV